MEDLGVKQKLAERTAYLSLVGNVLLAAIKLLAGIFGNSFALIADAVESVSDVFATVLVIIGIKYVGRPADENHPYGHGRAEPLFTFVVVGLLISSAIYICVQGVINMSNDHEIPEAFTLYILGGIILYKEGYYRFILNRSKKSGSTILKADAWHHRSDAITSLVAFIGILLAIILGSGYQWLDDLAAIIASGFIIYNAYKIFRPALGELMDEQIHGELVDQIRIVAEQVSGVEGTEKCFIRKVGMHYHVDLHLEVDGNISVSQGHEIAHITKDNLRMSIPELADVHIHVEPK